MTQRRSKTSPEGYPTLLARLRHLADTRPDDLAYQFLVDGKKEGDRATYSELDRRVRAIAAQLQQHESRGERALLLYPQSLEVVAAFLGCLYAGVIAIPVPPPEAGRLKRTLPRLRAIVRDAQATIALTTNGVLSLIAEVRDEFPEFEQMRWTLTEGIDSDLADDWHDPNIDSDTLAYLQYTSGSTSTPKGVMLTHHNLTHHLSYLQRACGYDPDSVTVSWMPYFHDYGLVEGLMEPLYNGTPCYFMSPFSFVKRPLRWLQALTRYQGTHSQAPNFAYDLSVRRHKPKDAKTLDLSRWQAAGNAAEPINPMVMANFYQTFSECGFRWNAFAPSYGLAEDTLLVSTKPKRTDPVLIEVDASQLEQNQVVLADNQTQNVRAYPSCGQLVCETQVAIVDPDTHERRADNEVGEIWVSDPSVAVGYWKRPDATRETFDARLRDSHEGPFLRTGDLGFLHNGELFVTGRIKDLIIIHGTNHYPQDIEWTVQELHAELRPDYGAAFSIDVRGIERLVVVQEVDRRAQTLDPEQTLTDIRQAISEVHEAQAYAVVLAKPGTILKTSSGKIQRRACRENFLNGQIDAIADWSEDPTLTARFRSLDGDIESLAQKVSPTR